MKYILSAVLMALLITSYSQCPQSGLKVQSKDCENPKGLAVTSINCTEMKVKWLGNKSQAYVVKASTANADEESATALKVSEVMYDGRGNCTAVIKVAEGVTVDWLVEAVCTAQGITTYSEAVSGQETYIPICSKVVKETNAATGLQAYPNPSKGLLTVDYTGKIESTLQISIYDVNGKKTFTRSEAASSGTTNQFQLNLQSLTPGTYMLETLNGQEVKRMKFVLMRE